jgi:hypothetical protein
VEKGEMYYEEIGKEAFSELDAKCLIKKPITNEEVIQLSMRTRVISCLILLIQPFMINICPWFRK